MVHGMGVLIVLVGSVLILQQGEGTVAEGIAPPAEQAGHSHAQEVSTVAPQHHVHGEVSSQNSVGGQLYSLFMHHAAGYFVFAIGILLALDRATQSRRCSFCCRSNSSGTPNDGLGTRGTGRQLVVSVRGVVRVGVRGRKGLITTNWTRH